ncbi:hypothetical protein BN439_1093 [Erwinia amylovora Ea644]|nr:hypothetical protein BN439_1093 [Erwinia amylovora Ea644]CCP06202.1 hypothetical protein BN440_1157 [Erwinia amylovora MR1]
MRSNILIVVKTSNPIGAEEEVWQGELILNTGS